MTTLTIRNALLGIAMIIIVIFIFISILDGINLQVKRDKITQCVYAHASIIDFDSGKCFDNNGNEIQISFELLN